MRPSSDRKLLTGNGPIQRKGGEGDQLNSEAGEVCGERRQEQRAEAAGLLLFRLQSRARRCIAKVLQLTRNSRSQLRPRVCFSDRTGNTQPVFLLPATLSDDLVLQAARTKPPGRPRRIGGRASEVRSTFLQERGVPTNHGQRWTLSEQH